MGKMFFDVLDSLGKLGVSSRRLKPPRGGAGDCGAAESEQGINEW
jgi:hypothetical protein